MTRGRLVAWVVLGLAMTGCGGDPAGQPPRSATNTPGSTPAQVDLGRAAPVWWDADGLHRGDVVAETSVHPEADAIGGLAVRRLALVRTGAVYRDARTGQVWFHPWDDTPHVIGRSTVAGPGGDPEGDVAVWFDGRDLVVYDTARDEVVSRSQEAVAVSPSAEYAEHVGHGNGWVHVSSSQVVWRYEGQEGHDLARRDLVTGTSEVPWQPRPASGTEAGSGVSFVDVSSRSAVWVGGQEHAGRGTYVYDRAGSARTRTVGATLEYPGRLSPDGTWLLTAEIADGTHGVAFTELSSGETWKPFEEDTYAFFSWAYGDVAVMLVNRRVPEGSWTLTSCTPATRTCVEVDTRGAVALPTP
ncbi:hypothetical protein GCM10011376_27200 [Nocardioides flavus (ex Wang et al. 2016)]|uniref:PQQ-like domain-containing protein n=1 Tax=Nocardioides flavus (ex Wang et al. 2016) TaxID=2058780 RepID=A0ABQ3HKA5_9ACTN|nr:hypothetical protein [Nocardioides flavus (ex Wang et al. 2016)]GHE18110.1 hypothetical protein GCM10011376_27200 [Nocardioides flavus (ex Wang et al. 2016)]